MTIQEAALQYVKLGWGLLPIAGGPSKDESKRPPVDPTSGKPMGWGPLAEIPATEAQVAEWFERWPNANIGLILQTVRGPEGEQLACVDTDSEASEAWVQSQSPLPVTPCVQTGRGMHRYYWAAPGLAHFPGDASAPELPEVRAGTHYNALPPSVHYTGVIYEWRWGEHGPLAIEEGIDSFAALPEWGVALMQRAGAARKRKGVAPQEPVGEGGRNNAVLGVVGKWVSVGLPEEAIRRAALEWNAAWCSPPLEEREVLGVVASCLRYGPKEAPREVAARVGEKRRTEDALLASTPAIPPPDAPMIPVSLRQEQLVIGGMVRGKGAREWCVGNLTPADFQHEGLREVFSVLRDTHRDRTPIDAAIIAARLNGRAPGIDADYLTQLTHAAPGGAIIKQHATELRATATQWALRGMAEELVSHIGREPTNATGSLGYAQVRLREIAEATQLDNRGQHVAEFAGPVLDDIEARRQREWKAEGLRTGIDEFDQRIPLSEQALVVFSGQSGFGKTTLAAQCLWETGIAYLGSTTDILLVYMLEGSKRAFTSRFLAWRAAIDETWLRPGGAKHMSDEQTAALMQAESEFPRLPLRMAIHIRDIDAIEADVRSAALEGNVIGVLVDYVQLVTGGVGGKEHEQLSNVAKRLALLADEVGAPVILTSQVTIQQDGRHTEKGATGIREPADLAVEIDRGELGSAAHAKTESAIVRLLCQKARNDPPFGAIELEARFGSRQIYGAPHWARLKAADAAAVRTWGTD